MGKSSQRKGRDRERQLVNMHRAIEVWAERVPLSGAAAYQGGGHDVDVYPWGSEGPPLCGEVKARAAGQGFKTIENWLADNDILFLVRDRQEPMVVLPWNTWRRLLKR